MKKLICHLAVLLALVCAPSALLAQSTQLPLVPLKDGTSSWAVGVVPIDSTGVEKGTSANPMVVSAMAPVQGFTDSTTALGSSSTFTGTGRSLASVPGIGFFNASVYTDQAGTLYVDQSLDSGSTYQPIASLSVAAASGGQLSVPTTGAQTSATLYRVRYVNGASAQSVFRLSSSFTAS